MEIQQPALRERPIRGLMLWKGLKKSMRFSDEISKQSLSDQVRKMVHCMKQKD